MNEIPANVRGCPVALEVYEAAVKMKRAKKEAEVTVHGWKMQYTIRDSDRDAGDLYCWRPNDTGSAREGREKSGVIRSLVMLRDVLDQDPEDVYRGLLTVLLRMVFLLYAEERSMRETFKAMD